MKKPKPRPIGIRRQRLVARELATLASYSQEIFRESIRIEIDTLGDAANLLRSASGQMQATISQFQRMADTLERIGAEVKRGAQDPHDGIATKLAALAQMLKVPE